MRAASQKRVFDVNVLFSTGLDRIKKINYLVMFQRQSNFFFLLVYFKFTIRYAYYYDPPSIPAGLFIKVLSFKKLDGIDLLAIACRQSTFRVTLIQDPFFYSIRMNRPQPAFNPTTPLPISQPTVPVVFGLFLATLLTPLVYSDSTFFGFISERTWYFNLLVEAMVIVAIFGPGFFTVPLTRLQTAVVLFVMVLFVADGWGVDPVQSYFSGYSRMEGFLLYLHLGLYFFVLTRLSLPKRKWNLALLMSTGIAVFVVLKGYFSADGRQAIDHRLISTIGNPSFLASYLLLHVFVAGYLFTQFIRVNRLLRGLLTGLSIVTLAGGIYLTGTRSAVLGLVSGSIFLGIFLVWHRYRTASKIGFGLVGLAVGLTGLFWLARTSTLLQKSPVLYRLTHYSGDNNTLSPRFTCWKIALNGVLDRPLLGWGQENFSYGFARHYDPAILLSGNSDWYDRAHNVLLDWAFSSGFTGLLAYLFIWFSLAYSLRRKAVLLTLLEKGLLTTVFIAYFSFNLLNFDSLVSLQVFFMLLAFIDTEPALPATSLPRPPWLIAARAGVLSAVLLLANYAVYEPWQTLRQLDRQQKMDNVTQRINALETTYNGVTARQLDLADCMQSLTLPVLKSNFPQETKQLCYQKTAAAMMQQIDLHPGYTRLMARAASLFLAGGDVDKTIQLCQQIIAIEGNKRPSAFLQLGNAYLYKNSFPEAQAAFDKAYRLQPRWEDPLLYKALAFAIQRDTTQCFKLLHTINTYTLVNKLAFVKQIYQQAGYPHKFVERIDQTERKEVYSPQVFVEWTLAAFDSKDNRQMTNALNSFYNHYLHQRFTYPEIKQLIDEGNQGIRPDRLVSMTSTLSQ